jgi:ATP-dependent DNA ligase
LAQCRISFGSLDGYRSLLLKTGAQVQLRSRNDKDFNRLYPEVVRLGARLTPHQLVLNEEIVALDPDGRPSFHAL